MKKLILLLQQMSLSPKLNQMQNSKIRLEFKGTWVKQDKVTFRPRNVVNLLSMN